jgi:hypothetical protein
MKERESASTRGFREEKLKLHYFYQKLNAMYFFSEKDDNACIRMSSNISKVLTGIILCMESLKSINWSMCVTQLKMRLLI